MIQEYETQHRIGDPRARSSNFLVGYLEALKEFGVAELHNYQYKEGELPERFSVIYKGRNPDPKVEKRLTELFGATRAPKVKVSPKVRAQ